MSLFKKIFPLIIGGIVVVVLVVFAITKQKKDDYDQRTAQLSAKTSEGRELSYVGPPEEGTEQAQSGRPADLPPSTSMTTEMPTAYNVAPSMEPVIEQTETGKVFKNYAQNYSFTIPEGYSLVETPRVIYLTKDPDTRIAVVYGIGPYTNVDSAGGNLASPSMLSTIYAKRGDETYIFDYYAPQNFQYPNEISVQDYVLSDHAFTPDYVEGKTYEELMQEYNEEQKKTMEEAEKNSSTGSPAETSNSVIAPEPPTPAQTSITQDPSSSQKLGNLRTEDFELRLACEMKYIIYKGQARVLRTEKGTGVMVIPLSETVDQSEQVKAITDSFKIETMEESEPAYTTFESDGIKFEYPEDWSVTQQGKITTIKAPTGSASPYYGTVISVHIDKDHEIPTLQHYLNVLEDDILAATFIEPVSKNDYARDQRITVNENAEIAGVPCIYYEVADIIKPYSDAVSAYLGPLGHVLSSKRYCFEANGRNNMINITGDQKSDKIWKHIIETFTIS